MYKIPDIACKKCGGNTSIHWDKGEISSGMDIKPLRSEVMVRSCTRCGYEERVSTLDENKELA